MSTGITAAAWTATEGTATGGERVLLPPVLGGTSTPVCHLPQTADWESRGGKLKLCTDWDPADLLETDNRKPGA